MNCLEFDNLIMPYLSEALDDSLKEEFELHYFSCEKCFVNLEIAESIYSGKVPVRTGIKKKSLFFKPVFVLNSLLLLVIFAISMFIVTGNIHDSKYYEISKFEPPVYIVTELRGNNLDKTFDKAMTFYNQKEYKSALKELNLIKIDRKKNYKVIFFRGVCKLLTDDLEMAVRDFSVIINDMNPAYFDEAIYYKSIALLRMGKVKASVSQLKNLSTDKYSPLSEQAIELIERIESR